MSGIVIAARCNWCSRQRPLTDVMRLSTGQIMCSRCYGGHAHGLDVLSGAMPRGCQGCGLTTEQLNALTNLPTMRMYVVPKDGVYQVLCLACKELYCAKRADLYRNTQFGHEVLKLG